MTLSYRMPHFEVLADEATGKWLSITRDGTRPMSWARIVDTMLRHYRVMYMVLDSEGNAMVDENGVSVIVPNDDDHAFTKTHCAITIKFAVR